MYLCIHNCICALVSQLHIQTERQKCWHTPQSVYIILFEKFINEKRSNKENFLCLIGSMSFPLDLIEFINIETELEKQTQCISLMYKGNGMMAKCIMIAFDDGYMKYT